MGFSEPCFADREDELIDQALTTDHPYFAGITRERLEREGQVALNLPTNAAGESLPFSDASWFGHASGRAELLPVPVFTPPTESRNGAAARSGDYPLEFLPRKADNYMNSTFANIPRHQRMESRTAGTLEMHAADAAARGLADGDAVEVFNGRGVISLHARIGQLVPQGVVSARLDWNKLSGSNSASGHSGSNGASRSNVNALTSETLTDIGAGATFYSTLVEVRRAPVRRDQSSSFCTAS
jgi:anaerobic selenocysteine-containing dehydrogenase